VDCRYSMNVLIMVIEMQMIQSLERVTSKICGDGENSFLNDCVGPLPGICQSKSNEESNFKNSVDKVPEF
jgi:hypothetical protein